jgi:hypothetical protein
MNEICLSLHYFDNLISKQRKKLNLVFFHIEEERSGLLNTIRWNNWNNNKPIIVIPFNFTLTITILPSSPHQFKHNKSVNQFRALVTFMNDLKCRWYDQKCKSMHTTCLRLWMT